MSFGARTGSLGVSMILPRISIQRPILAWMMNLVLVLFGLATLKLR